MQDTRISEFTDKIIEAITKFQGTLPKKLSEKEIQSMKSLIKEYVTYTLERGNGMNISLYRLLSMAINDGNRAHVDNDAYMPDQINSHIDRSKQIIDSSPILSDPEEGKLAANIPFLSFFISDSLLGIANHAGQYLYCSDDTYKTTDKYFVKSHEQTLKEYERSKEEQSYNPKEPDEQS